MTWLTAWSPVKAQNVLSSNSINVAGFQMNVSSDINQNKKHILRGIQQAADSGAQFLVTPEGSLSGYTSDFDQDELAVALDEIVTKAQSLGVGLMLGTCYKEEENGDDYYYNQVRVYSPEGEYLGAHSKILRGSTLSHPGSGEMTEYVEGTLRTFEYDGVNFGILICNDLWATPGYTTMPNPYLPWKLKQMGAQAIFQVINSGTDQRYRTFHESSVSLWAMNLQIPIMGVNAARESQKINARSGLVGPKGDQLLDVPYQNEQFFVTEIPL